MSTPRTDAHSPSHFDPAEYEYRGSFDAWGSSLGEGPRPEWELQAMARLADSSHEGNWSERGTCDHCGARIRYVCVWLHTPSGDHIATGEQCAGERFDLPSRVAHEQSLLRKRAAAQAKRLKALEQALAQHEATPGLGLALLADHDITRDLARKQLEYGTLSEAQVGLAFKLARQGVERAEAQAERDAEVKCPAPEGKVTATGDVVSVKWQENQFGGRLVMTVKFTGEDGAVWLGWGSVPAGLKDIDEGDGYRNVDRGDRVTFSATFTQSDRDPSFAFFKRPTKASLSA